METNGIWIHLEFGSIPRTLEDRSDPKGYQPEYKATSSFNLRQVSDKNNNVLHWSQPVGQSSSFAALQQRQD